MGCLLSDTGTRVAGASSLNHLLEYKHQPKPKFVGSETDVMPKVVTTYSAKKFFGKSFGLADDSYRGTASTNPTENAFFEVWACSNGSNNPSAMNFDVLIEFIAYFSEPQEVAIS